MSRSFISSTGSRWPGLALALGSAFATMSASAQTHPGNVGNLLLKNAYTNPADDQFGYDLSTGDYNGDGISDLAVTKVGGTLLRVYRGNDWDIGGAPGSTFLSNTIDSEYHNSPMASGDFDGDGLDEIAVGAPGISSGGQSRAGGVYVLDRRNGEIWSTQSEIRAGASGYPGTPQQNAELGSELAAADFDGDGFDDLAIAIRGQTVADVVNAGAVMIVYGTSNGLVSNGAQLYNRSNDGLGFVPSEDDRFGFALAAADFDNDGNGDLAIGVPLALCSNGIHRSGAVIEMHGSTSVGITTAQTHIWRPGTQGVSGSCASTEDFGVSLASASFDALENFADLAIGAPDTSPGGAVHILHGAAGGLSSAGNQRLSAPNLPGVDSTNSRFGAVLAAGDLAHQCSPFCRPDSLAVGAPKAEVGGVEEAGAVWVFDTFSGNPNAASVRSIVASPALRVGAPHQNDFFGSSLAIGDFNDDNLADLAIGVPNFDDGGETDAGAVQVLFQSDYIFLGRFDTSTQ